MGVFWVSEGFRTNDLDFLAVRTHSAMDELQSAFYLPWSAPIELLM
jgi:hypothetical protein